jgi:hypothetical protein
MIAVFNKAVFPMIEFIKCIMNKMEDPNYALYLIPDTYKKQKANVDICYEDFSLTDPKCHRICEVDLQNFAIKMSFVQNYKQALKSIPNINISNP